MTTTAKRSQGNARRRPADEAEAPTESPSLRPVPTGANIPVPSDRDRVVDRLMRDGALSLEDVAAWRVIWSASREEGSKEPFWRFVTRQDGVDAAWIARTAADVYGFAPVRISLVGSLAVADYLGSVWPSDAFVRLVAHGAVPVAPEGPSTASRLVVASSDPANAELARVMDDLVPGPYELRFATIDSVGEVVDAIRRHLPGLIPDGVVRLGRTGAAPTTLRRAA